MAYNSSVSEDHIFTTDPKEPMQTYNYVEEEAGLLHGRVNFLTFVLTAQNWGNLFFFSNLGEGLTNLIFIWVKRLNKQT